MTNKKVFILQPEDGKFKGEVKGMTDGVLGLIEETE